VGGISSFLNQTQLNNKREDGIICKKKKRFVGRTSKLRKNTRNADREAFKQGGKKFSQRTKKSLRSHRKWKTKKGEDEGWH